LGGARVRQLKQSDKYHHEDQATEKQIAISDIRLFFAQQCEESGLFLQEP
jgi:hypothetical protein